MVKYRKVDVSEQRLEDLVRQHADAIEDALVYVDHQHSTLGGRLDVLMVDSGESLVVAELKVVEDDGMLLQGLDYYDYVSTHREAFARLYKAYAPIPLSGCVCFWWHQASLRRSSVDPSGSTPPSRSSPSAA
jgi:hypothetical protein